MKVDTIKQLEDKVKKTNELLAERESVAGDYERRIKELESEKLSLKRDAEKLREDFKAVAGEKEKLTKDLSEKSGILNRKNAAWYLRNVRSES